MTNMVYASPNISVIEFVMTPHSNRCFGFMAEALSLDYWAVTELTTYYHLKYEATKKNVAAVMRTLEHVIRSKGLEHLLVSRDDL